MAFSPTRTNSLLGTLDAYVRSSLSPQPSKLSLVGRGAISWRRITKRDYVSVSLRYGPDPVWHSDSAPALASACSQHFMSRGCGCQTLGVRSTHYSSLALHTISSSCTYQLVRPLCRRVSFIPPDALIGDKGRFVAGRRR